MVRVFESAKRFYMYTKTNKIHNTMNRRNEAINAHANEL